MTITPPSLPRIILHTTMLICCSVQSTFAATKMVQCPGELAATSVKVEPAPEGWTPYIPSVIYLSSAGLMAGPPAMIAELKPYSDTNEKGKSVALWKLGGAPYPEGLWLSCGYGAKGEVTLSKQIGGEYKECTITSKKGKKAFSADIEVSCK